MAAHAAQRGDHQVLNDGLKNRLWRLCTGMPLLILLLYGITAAVDRTRQRWIEPFSARARSVPIGATPAKRGDLDVYLNLAGTVTPLKTVVVHTRVDGELVDVYVKEGQTVKRGDLLAEIDPRPYQVQLTQAQAQLARDRASLDNAQAQLARFEKLFQQNIISRLELDAQQNVAGQYMGVLRSDQALVDGARLELANCRITSTINGRVGLWLVDPGNIVRAADTRGLMVITQLNPVAVTFSITTNDLRRVMEAIKGVPPSPIDAYDVGFKNRIATGTVLALDNDFDQTKGSVKLKASFPNQDNALLANEVVSGKLRVATLHDAVLIPMKGVRRNSQGTFVYVAKSDGTVVMRSVMVRATQGDTSAISWGLNPGELVVVNGADQMHAGSGISVRVAANHPTRRNVRLSLSSARSGD